MRPRATYDRGSLDNRHLRYPLGRMQSYLEKRDRETNQARYYAMAVMPNLFGEWTLCRHWGRIGASRQERLDLLPPQG